MDQLELRQAGSLKTRQSKQCRILSLCFDQEIVKPNRVVWRDLRWRRLKEVRKLTC